MKNVTKISLLSLIIFCACSSQPAKQVEKNTHYESNWESLQTHKDPEWLKDAKFGIYFHWGVYSVAAHKNEWYSYYMYRTQDELGAPDADSVRDFHIKNYGPLEEFSYRNFIPMFKAEKFDADEWAQLFKDSGAKFAGLVAEHSDGFAMWNSELTEWNAYEKGPKRDIVGEMEKAIKKRDMKFITTFHHQWLWGWYPTWDKNLETSDPKYSGLYGPYVPKGFPVEGPHDNLFPRPDSAFNAMFTNKVLEVLDNYHPDLLWFDARLKLIEDENLRKIVSYFYNQGVEQNKEVTVIYKNQDLPLGVGTFDYEMARPDSIKKNVWINDDTIDWMSWSDVNPANYKSIEHLIGELVDVVSKNGVLMLNITPKADGTIPGLVKERILAMGEWLKINGEAIYGTRPWEVFGEGPTKPDTLVNGSFREWEIGDYSEKDIRFTQKDGNLYAITLAVPENGEMLITSLADHDKINTNSVKSIELLGEEGVPEWEFEESGLMIKVSGDIKANLALVAKIELKN